MRSITWQIFFCLIHTISTIQGYQALVVSPIADLTNAPLSAQEYNTMPICGGQKEPFTACKRGHQVIFNEVINVVKHTNNHACIALPNIFYITQNKDKKHNQYWVEKKHIVPLDTIVQKEWTKIPSPISPVSPEKKDNEVILISPYHDPSLNTTFSVGTRFVRVYPHKKANNIAVWVFDKTALQFKKIRIPITKCLLSVAKNPDARIKQFVQLVRSWAHLKEGYIPYVWGGSSSSNLAHSHDFTEEKVIKNNKTASYYAIKNYTACPMTGFDCSSLISRAAQICNIPYFFKNTTTLAHYLYPISKYDHIKNGDLIWIPWHVMIVSDVKKNLLVEARSYNHGYGKVHELPLDKVFKGIHTYQELADRMLAKKPIERIDTCGRVADTFLTFKILKMDSVFNQPSAQE